MATITQTVGMWGPGVPANTATSASNPWSEATRSLQGKLGKAWDTMEAQGTAPFGGSTSPTVVRPEDADVQGYLANMMGSQRNTMDEYVKQAAGAGIKRGGLNVVGGPSAESSLHHEAMQELAQGYGDVLQQSMNYAKYARATEANRQRENLNNLLNLMKLQHQYISSEADWNAKQAKTQAAARLAASIKSSQSAHADGSAASKRQDGTLSDTEMARWRNALEIQSHQRQLLDNEEKANRLAKFEASYPYRDYLLSEEAMTQQGIVSPWKRTLKIG